MIPDLIFYKLLLVTLVSDIEQVQNEKKSFTFR